VLRIFFTVFDPKFSEKVIWWRMKTSNVMKWTRGCYMMTDQNDLDYSILKNSGANKSQLGPWTQLKTLDSFSSFPYLSSSFLSPQKVPRDLPLKSSLSRISRWRNEDRDWDLSRVTQTNDKTGSEKLKLVQCHRAELEVKLVFPDFQISIISPSSYYFLVS